MADVTALTLSMLGLMQRTKKGLDTLRVAMREWRESWETEETTNQLF